MPELSLKERVNLSNVEEERIRDFLSRLLPRTVGGVLTHPLALSKVLFQLGHEPYPLTTGKIFIFIGRQAYFLPNAFQYLLNIYREYGFRTLFTGLDAGILSFVTGGMVSFISSLYLDRYYPEIGGNIENIKNDKEEMNLTNHESFRLRLRDAIRDTITHSIGIIVSRPFTVIMVREIAQIVGHENRYNNLLSSLLRIGYEEGPKGYFSGLISALLTETITIWGCFTIKYGVERALIYSIKDSSNEDELKAFNDCRKSLNFIIPFFVNSFSYPFSVISTIMSLNGSGLIVSMLPYTPLFNHWYDCYDHLKPHGLTRGARLFLREQKRSVSVRHGHQIYASNNHFI